jgi:hypothetical protein
MLRSDQMTAQRLAIAKRFHDGNAVNEVTEEELRKRKQTEEPAIAAITEGDDDEEDFEDETGDMLGALCGVVVANTGKAKASGKAKGKAVSKASCQPAASAAKRPLPLAVSAVPAAASRPVPTMTAAPITAGVVPMPSPRKGGRKAKVVAFQFDPQAYLDADGMDALHTGVKELNDILKQDLRCNGACLPALLLNFVFLGQEHARHDV